MPVYKILSEEIIQKWQVSLDELTINLIKCPKKENIEMFLIALNEYLMISIGHKVRYNGEAVENAKISLDDIKKVSSSTEMRLNFRFLKDIADSIRHTYCEANTEAFFLDLVKTESLREIWVSFLPNGSKVQKLLLNKEKMLSIHKEVFNPKELKNQCYSIVDKYLEVCETSKRSKYTISEIIVKLCKETSCSYNFAIQIVVFKLKDAYMV